MSNAKKLHLKRIFYFNITYSCNNRCVFCYSHNTRQIPHYNEIDFDMFTSYLRTHGICADDRVIINGGEPLMHEEIASIVNFLNDCGCEVLIYTNGTFLGSFIRNIGTDALNKNFRFIFPIHGDEKMHDAITCNCGSYKNTINGVERLLEKTKCLVDMKIIVNHKMANLNAKDWERLLFTFLKIPLNNSLQITKMADTIVSKSNNCPSLPLDFVATATVDIYNAFKDGCRSVKIYDTCVRKFDWILGRSFDKYSQKIEVLFKDYGHEYEFELTKNILPCTKECIFSEHCISAVHEYKTLEINKNIIRENLE